MPERLSCSKDLEVLFANARVTILLQQQAKYLFQNVWSQPEDITNPTEKFVFSNKKNNNNNGLLDFLDKKL